MLVEILVSQVADVLLEQGVDVGRGRGIVVEILGMPVADEHQIRQRIADPLHAVSRPQRRVLPEDAADRLQVGPARHRVVAHQQEPTRRQPRAGDRQDRFPHLRRHPAQHAVQGDEVELTQVVGERGEVGGHQPHVREAAGVRLPLRCGDVLGIDVHAHELPLGIGSRECGERPPEPAAEFEIAKAGGRGGRDHAIDRRRVADGDRGQVRIETGDVGDVRDVAVRGNDGTNSRRCTRRSRPSNPW